MKILKLWLCTVLATGLMAGAIAQEKTGQGRGDWQGKGHHKDGFPHFGRGVLSKLDLTEQQKQRIERVSRPKLEEVRKIQESDLSREIKRERIGKVIRELQTEIQAILTPSQREEMRRLMDEARKKAKDRQKGGGSKVPPPRL